MEILFCSICNESVPVGHLADGRAFRRNDRVVCATCDVAMGGGGKVEAAITGIALEYPASPMQMGGAQPQPGGTHMPSMPKPRRRKRLTAGGGGLMLGGLALFVALGVGVAGGILIVKVMEESNLQRDNLRDGHDGLALKVTHLDDRLSAMLPGISGEIKSLESELGKDFDLVARDLSAKIRGLSMSIESTGTRITALEETMRALDADLHTTDNEMQVRLDNLALTALRDGEDLSRVMDRLVSLEDLVHSGALAPPSTGEELDVGPAWQVALDDLANPDSAVRWNAVQALAESGDPAVVPHLVPLLTDEDVWVRMAAAGALGDLGAASAIEPLIDTLEDEETAVRERAMLSLRGITGRTFQFNPDGSENEREKAIKKWRSWWKKASADLAD